MTRLLFVALFLLAVAPGVAQTVINPRFVDFTASPDHSATKLDGTFVVTRYEAVSMQMNGTGALVWTQDLGKPTPNGAGLITMPLPTVLPITPETLYTMRITVLGPDGSSAPSTVSNPFGVAGTRLPAGVGSVVLRAS